MKNAFYLVLKALLFLKIVKFFSRLFGHIGKTAWLERQGYDVTIWFTNNCNIQIAQYLTK